VFEIRPARPGEREAVARFLHRSFKQKIPLERWRALLDGRWDRSDGGYGVALLDAGELVGFLGVVHADRPFERGTVRTGNLSSWYLQRHYRGRGLGLEMLRAATADAGVIYTTFSSVPRALRLMERVGLGPLDETRLLWRPQQRSASAAARVAATSEDAVRLLDGAAAAVFRDHGGLRLERLAVEIPGTGLLPLVLAVQRKHDDHLTYEVLHVGRQDLFAEHARAVADAILPPSGAVLSVDRRFVPEGVDSGAMEAIPVPRYYRPGLMAPSEVDFLYSETVLLDLKLY
jgi:uncharacterized protein YbaA (DUF1428 family)